MMEETSSPFEMLGPEIQTMIMQVIPDPTTLQSLIKASPRTYQIYDSRRSFHLSELARWQFDYEAFTYACDVIKSSDLAHPISRDGIRNHLDSIWHQNFEEVLIMPSQTSIALINLGRRVNWFVADFARETLQNLTLLGELEVLEQDPDVIHEQLSPTELGRLQRAFCLFELHHQLFAPHSDGTIPMTSKEQAHEFIQQLEVEDVEEITCIRDYLVRRLWTIFDRMEDQFVLEGSQSSQEQALKGYQTWYGKGGKVLHDIYIEGLMSEGLPLLQEIFTSDLAKAEDLVICHSRSLEGYLTQALQTPPERTPEFYMRLRAHHHSPPLTFAGDDMMNASIGFLWGHNWKVAYEAANPGKKGLRDWGYVFWDERRISASGVLDRCAHDIALIHFNDVYRSEDICAEDRLQDQQLTRTPRTFKKC